MLTLKLFDHIRIQLFRIAHTLAPQFSALLEMLSQYSLQLINYKL